jgi:hypothetical protein
MVIIIEIKNLGKPHCVNDSSARFCGAITEYPIAFH